jgi:hypothetical protein
MKKQLILILIALFLCSAAALGQSKTGIRRTDFMNFSYRSSICTENFEVPNPVKVTRGKFAKGEAWFDIQAKALYSDLNGDGSEDAVVHAKCASTAGNFNNSEIFAYGMQGAKVKLLASFDNNKIERDYKRYVRKGFIVSVKNVSTGKGRIVVEAYADGSNAGPIHIVTFNYKLSRSGASLSGKPKVRRSEFG